ncbi:MAG: flagellar protein FliT [Xanthomonadaceae bacterium]|nr:flagellar protein FliT [Xanthomonadaceae bacterium]
MSDDRHPDLERALQLGGQMLDAARAGDWPRVTALQPQCDALLRRGHAADESARIALLGLQSQHQMLSELVAQARDGIAREIARHAQTHRALSAYLDSSAAH